MNSLKYSIRERQERNLGRCIKPGVTRKCFPQKVASQPTLIVSREESSEPAVQGDKHSARGWEQERRSEAKL